MQPLISTEMFTHNVYMFTHYVGYTYINGLINKEYIVYIVPNSLLIGSPDVIILIYKHLRVTVCCIMWKLCAGKVKLYSVNLCCIGVQ